MLDKQRLVSSIARMAKRLGRAPSLLEFVTGAQIPRNSVFRLFPRWNEAVRAAGLQPHRLYARPENHEVLADWGETVRKLHAVPSRRAYDIHGKYHPLTVQKRFVWEQLPQAFRGFAAGRREWADVLALLPASESKANRQPLVHSPASLQGKSKYARVGEGATYGDPLDFPFLRHEPVNELGVVLLFGMLAKELGYVVESMQAGFPDCEAKRQIGPKRWQRVQIEFEFESRNFLAHNHPLTGCDVIVCWHHNWPDCPAHIEVLELSSRIKSLPASQG
jgi:hypothetical protein